MGEFIKLKNGDHVKLGTCGNLYYATYAQVKAAVEAGATELEGNLEPREYLDPEHGWRYRFPFPDEVSDSFTAREDFDRGALVKVPAEFHVDREHGKVRLPVKAGSGLFKRALRFSSPCPFSKDALAGVTGESYVEIVFQKQVEGCLWTVARCPYCRTMWRLPANEAYQLCDFNTSETNPFYVELFARIKAGYAGVEFAGQPIQ